MIKLANYLSWLVGTLTFLTPALAAESPPLKLEQLVSRENPAFDCSAAVMTVGKDGAVYLCNVIHDGSFVMRLKPDGSSKLSALIEDDAGNATANAKGIIATPNAHFLKKVVLFNAGFKKVGEIPGFLGGDDVGWDGPIHVEAGDSGDFYALDQHRSRVVQFTASAKIVRTFALPPEPAHSGDQQDFRVSEKTQAFYVVSRQPGLKCVGFDGVVRWMIPGGYDGGFDVDGDGNLYVIDQRSDQVRVVDARGKETRHITLAMGQNKPGGGDIGTIDGLRVFGDDLLIKRRDPVELFQRYDRNAGAFKNRQTAAGEHFSLTAAGDPWIAGTAVPFKVDYSSAASSAAPQWRVWAKPFGSLAYERWTMDANGLRVPGDASGIYQIKITPDLLPWQRGLPSEYLLQTVVEVRSPLSTGSVTVTTPGGRSAFGRGEKIPISVLLRTPPRNAATPLMLHVLHDGKSILDVPHELPAAQAEWHTDLIANWVRGDYRITVSGENLSCSGQWCAIGPGVFDGNFQTIIYGDYGGLIPETHDLDAADLVAGHAERMNRLGFDMVIDRLGDTVTTGGFNWYNGAFASLTPLKARLESDPAAAAPRKLELQSVIPQKIARYGADGIYEMGILMRNDASLPIEKGVPFDGRSLQECIDDLKLAASKVKDLPAFRGWSWTSNWWVTKRDGDTARTPQERAEWDQALAKVDTTGHWSPIFDTLGDLRFSYAVSAQQSFNDVLKGIDPKLVTASAGPFRNVQTYPPVSFGNVDETDLQAQWEQIAMPDSAAMNVDFYKRPGHRAWGHPEVFNDDGSGGQICSAAFQMLMSGADGVGQSGKVPMWQSDNSILDDPRTGYVGTASVWRALNPVLKAYGPWIASMEKADQVAIVASGRMFKIDRWKFQTGLHFARVLEAYSACLHAHRPASIVFAEDLKPDSLDRYKAILVVDQRVQLEQPLKDALHHAVSAGRSVFYDGTCRSEVVRDFKPLGFSFDTLDKDNALAGDDAAYWRFHGYARAHRDQLMAALKPLTTGDGDCDNDELLTRQRVSGQGRYLFVVNNAVPELNPGYLWRVNLAVASRMPINERVRLDAGSEAVYDVMAQKQVAVEGGTIEADCISVPARVFAILPRPIDGVLLKAPPTVAAGGALVWECTVTDRQGAVPAGVPVRVRLLCTNGSVLEERFLPATLGRAAGSIVAPINAPHGKVIIEATELLSGKHVSVSIKISGSTPDDMPDDISKPDPGTPSEAFDVPAESRFGPHIRDVAIIDHAGLAVLSAMNWDKNLYGVDLATGQTRWQQKVGDYFAFSPRQFGDSITAEGFEFKAAEGYRSYVVNASGVEQRRFSLYGLPARMSSRFVPGIVLDKIDNFAAAADGGWIASAGDLGLAVWSADGKKLWQQDWYPDHRHAAQLTALNHDTLLVTEATMCTAFNALTGATLWQNVLSPGGETRCIRSTPDGKTVAVLTTSEGGTLFILHDGKIASVIPTAGEDMSISADGRSIAVVRANVLKFYSVEKGLQWTLPADDVLHQPRISGDGGRISVGSELGTLYVASAAGAVLLQRDVRALPATAWTSDGDLIVATWMGKVCRLDSKFDEKWTTLLTPHTNGATKEMMADDASPLCRIESWINASAAPVNMSANLLTRSNALIKFAAGDPNFPVEFTRDPHLLIDGVGASQNDPWLSWNRVGWFGEVSPNNSIVIDTFRTQLRVKAITLFEDADHPESWLRDCTLEYWDNVAAQWKFAVAMRSDSAVHTHTLDQPAEASRFRLILPPRVVGNIRLRQIMFQGDILGASHPDVLAKKSVARLYNGDFTWKEFAMLKVKDDMQDVASVDQTDASRGGHVLTIPADGGLVPNFHPPFGSDFANWEFAIAEHPQPGEYRYLQFACRALSPATKGITLRFEGATGEANFTLFKDIIAGAEAAAPVLMEPVKVADAPPAQWKVYQVDLWQLYKRPIHIRAMSLFATGGGAAFDQILLGRTIADFPPSSK